MHAHGETNTMIHDLEQIILFVDDLEKAEEFYRARVGLTIQARKAGEWVEFATGGSGLILHRKVAGAAPFLPELVFRVADTPDVYHELRSRGVDFFLGPIQQSSGQCSAFCKDPDGNVLKLTCPA